MNRTLALTSMNTGFFGALTPIIGIIKSLAHQMNQ